MTFSEIHSDDHHDAIVERMETLLAAEGEEVIAELAALCIIAEKLETRSLLRCATAIH